jgi:hypothetical protein
MAPEGPLGAKFTEILDALPWGSLTRTLKITGFMKGDGKAEALRISNWRSGAQDHCRRQSIRSLAG